MIRVHVKDGIVVHVVEVMVVDVGDGVVVEEGVLDRHDVVSSSA
jgi:hypothetical protein